MSIKYGEKTTFKEQKEALRIKNIIAEIKYSIEQLEGMLRQSSIKQGQRWKTDDKK